MIPITKAISIIKQKTGSLGSGSVRLENSVSRILAEDIFADTDMPPFDRSQMDGYAVKAKDTEDAPVVLTIVGESAAGRGWHERLRSREAVRIMTGAPVPAGADAVQKLELASESDLTVTIREPVAKGRNIVRRGAEIKKGARLFRKGDMITERMIASLASFGYSNVRVGMRPSVAILATGTEIVPIDKRPGRDQIRNSNTVMLKAMCENAGAKVRILKSSGDDLERLKRLIGGAASETDILVITGGVSVGKYDLTKAALRELGAEIYFERVRLKPGKPTVFAQLNGTMVFGLPGNPVSAAVTFYLFVRVSIIKLQNALSVHLPQRRAILSSPVAAAKERDTYLPSSLSTGDDGKLIVTPLSWLGSSDFIGFADADSLVALPKGSRPAAGEVVDILLL